MKPRECFRFVGVMIILAIAFLGRMPGTLSQVAAEKQPASLPEFKTGSLPQDQKIDMWKGAKNSVRQTDSSLSSKPDFSDLEDHLAFILDFKGEVRILKHNVEQWEPVKKKMKIEVGDQILTGKDSTIDIAYDNHLLNIARIGANTKAEFRSIEPTEIHMEDGSIFSALDGLKSGDSYQISTRTAVAGVRGTQLYIGASGDSLTSVVFDEGDLKPHAATVSLLDPNFLQNPIRQLIEASKGPAESTASELHRDLYTYKIEEGQRLLIQNGVGKFESGISPELEQIRTDVLELREKIREEFQNETVEPRGSEKAQTREEDNNKRAPDDNGGNGPAETQLNKSSKGDSFLDDMLGSHWDGDDSGQKEDPTGKAESLASSKKPGEQTSEEKDPTSDSETQIKENIGSNLKMELESELQNSLKVEEKAWGEKDKDPEFLADKTKT